MVYQWSRKQPEWITEGSKSAFNWCAIDGFEKKGYSRFLKTIESMFFFKKHSMAKMCLKKGRLYKGDSIFRHSLLV